MAGDRSLATARNAIRPRPRRSGPCDLLPRRRPTATMLSYATVTTSESSPISSEGQAAGLAGLEDSKLLARMADRDEKALSELYRRYSSMLLGMSRRILGSTEDAEEVLQEVFIQAWAQAHRYDSKRASASTWLVLITRSRSIDLLRNRNVRRRTADNAGKEQYQHHTSPEGMSNVLSDERRQRVVAAMAKLPDEQRNVLELAFFRGWTQRQISEHNGTPLGTVKTRTLLAMKKLRASLQHEVDQLL